MLKSQDKLTEYFITKYGNKITTLYENFEDVVNNYPNNVYLIEKIQNINVSKTYKEISELRNHLGSGLIQLGIKNQQKVGVFTKSGINTTIIKHATEAYSMIFVCIPDKEEEEATEKVISICQFPIIFVDSEERLQKIKSIISKIGNKSGNKNNEDENESVLKFIVFDFDSGEETLKQNRLLFSGLGVRLVDWKEVVENGKNNFAPHIPPLPHYTSNIIFQNPFNKKFQEIKVTHRNFISFAGSLRKNGLHLSKNEKYFNYLDDNHYLNVALKNYIVSSSSQVGFSEGNKDILKEIIEFKPTILISPTEPSFFKEISTQIETHTKKFGAFTSFFYALVYESKKIFVSRKFQNSQPFFDTLAFTDIKNNFGNFKHIFSEEIVSPQFTEKFLVCFSSNIYNVLGGMFVSLPNDYTENNFGVPLSNVEITLQNEDEEGMGELCFRGPGVPEGLYPPSIEEKKGELVTDDTEDNKDVKEGQVLGWFLSGFFGKFDENGTLIQKKK
eukprot:TRINITY_DN4781_c0_g1_i1.p1 TRINITY_DN4781_c0_g1~~TRINITY_DN4781_c0_g1_i1.p1  ORF type:complete len:501 (-),score=146.54 TRINITY_DN4781_c0_g1_i1:18-1520(-)